MHDDGWMTMITMLMMVLMSQYTWFYYLRDERNDAVSDGRTDMIFIEVQDKSSCPCSVGLIPELPLLLVKKNITFENAFISRHGFQRGVQRLAPVTCPHSAG